MEDFTARVLVYDSDPDQRLRIIGRLGDRGYSNLIARSVDEALDIARTNQLDIIIVNASVPKKEQESLNAALKDLWETRHLPIILIGGDEDGNQPLDERDAALADFLPREFHDLELFSHLSSLVRLKTMQSELERRLATTVEFGGGWHRSRFNRRAASAAPRCLRSPAPATNANWLMPRSVAQSR